MVLDLPSLQSLYLGEESLLGVVNDTSCSLTMRSNNSIQQYHFKIFIILQPLLRIGIILNIRVLLFWRVGYYKNSIDKIYPIYMIAR